MQPVNIVSWQRALSYVLRERADVPESLASSVGESAMATAARDGLIEFQFADRDRLNQAIDALRAGGAEIESVAATTSTLEEVFFRTVQS